MAGRILKKHKKRINHFKNVTGSEELPRLRLFITPLLTIICQELGMHYYTVGINFLFFIGNSVLSPLPLLREN